MYFDNTELVTKTVQWERQGCAKRFLDVSDDGRFRQMSDPRSVKEKDNFGRWYQIKVRKTRELCSRLMASFQDASFLTPAPSCILVNIYDHSYGIWLQYLLYKICPRERIIYVKNWVTWTKQPDSPVYRLSNQIFQIKIQPNVHINRWKYDK